MNTQPFSQTGQIWRLLRARSSLTFRQTIECGFTLKLVRDMIIAYSEFIVSIMIIIITCSKPRLNVSALLREGNGKKAKYNAARNI